MNNLPEPLRIYTWLDDDGLVTATPEERLFLYNNLQIPENDPLTLYRLLGVREGETNLRAIDSGCDSKLAFLRTLQNGGNSKYVQNLLNIVAAARICLLDKEKRDTYDTERAARTAQEQTRSSVAQAVPAFIQPVEPLPTFTPQLSRPNKHPHGPIQKYAVAIGGGIALTAAALGAALWGISGNSKKDTANETPAVAKADDLTSPRSAPPAAGDDETIVRDLEEPPVEFVEEDTTFAKILEPTPPVVQEELPTPDIKPQIEVTPVSTASANTSQPTNGQSFVVMQQQVQPAPTIEIQQQAPKAQPEPRRGLMDLLPANEQPTQAPAPAITPPPRADIRVAAINRREVDNMKTTLENATREKSPADKAPAILEWANDPEMLKDPAAMKAIYELAFSKALSVKDVATCKKIVDHMTGQPGIFLAEDIVLHQKLLVALLAEQAKVAGTPAAKRLDTVQEILTLALATAQYNPTEALRFIADARKALPNTSSKEKRECDAKITSTENTIKKIIADNMRAAQEAENERALAAKEAADFDQANKTLSENPFDHEARKVRGQIYLSRGEALKALEDLAASNHAKAGLAQESLSILKSPKTAKGKRAMEIAQEWKTLAAMTKNGKQKTLYGIAKDLYDIALEANDEPLNPIEKKLVRDDLGSIPTTGPARSAESPNAQRSWKDVTRDIDLTKAKGEWYRKANGAIVMEPGINSRIILPVTVPQFGDFEASIRCKVTRTKGNNAIQVTIPLGNGTTLVVNGWPEKGGVSGLSLIDGNEANANESCVKGLAIGDSKPKLVEVSVKRKGSTGSVHLTIDGKPSVNWSGELSRLSNHPLHRIDDPQAFALGGYETQVEFSNIEMTLVTGAPAQPQAGAIRQASVERVSPQENRPAVEPNRPKNVPKEAVWNPEMKGWVYCPTAPLTVENTITLAKVTGGSIFYPKDDDGYRFIRENAPNKRILLPIRKAPNGMWVGPNGVIDSAKIKWMPGEPSGGHDEYFLVYNVREQGIEDIHEEPIHSIILYQAK